MAYLVAVHTLSRRAALFCCLFTVMLATPASAATVDVSAPDPNAPASVVLNYHAAPGEINSLAITVTEPVSPMGGNYYGGPTTYDLRDPGAAIQPGSSCRLVDGDPHHASCQSQQIGDLAVELGDGDDQLTVTHDPPRMFGPRLVASGGDGNDVLKADPRAGDQNNLYGGNGNDVLVGGTYSNALYGGGGDDRLVGGASSDLLCGGDPQAGQEEFWTYRPVPACGTSHTGADTIEGGDGNDQILSGDGRDFILAGAGNDWVNSGSGDDTVDLGPGNDMTSTDNDGDTINSRDGQFDTIGCGGDYRLPSRPSYIRRDAQDELAPAHVCSNQIADPPVPQIDLTGSTAPLNGGTVSLPLACPSAAPEACAGSLTLLRSFARGASASQASTAVSRLGSARFRVSHGHRHGLRIRLSRAARLALAQHPRLRVRFVAVTRDRASNRRETRRTLVIVRGHHRG